MVFIFLAYFTLYNGLQFHPVGFCPVFLLCKVRVVNWMFVLESSVILSQLCLCLSVLSSRGGCVLTD